MKSGRFVDVSHPIENGMVTYEGLPAPVVSEFLSREASRGKYADGTTFSIGRVEMVANTGTYVDAPFHRFGKGTDVADLPLERLADLEGFVVDTTTAGRAVGPEHFDRAELADRAVLVRTGWSRYWRTPAYFRDHPYLTHAAAERLVLARPALVGIDSLNIDDTRDGARPAHTLLLDAGIPIVEHLTNLERLPPSGFRFHAVPAPFRGLGSFPVRAYAVVAE
ncbi:MAG: cyclase family protein [Acidobacteriota bacterium]|nr:cyclase family protein [Acidobacteriota bacterium]